MELVSGLLLPALLAVREAVCDDELLVFVHSLVLSFRLLRRPAGAMLDVTIYVSRETSTKVGECGRSRLASLLLVVLQ